MIPLHSANLLTVLGADGSVRYESPSIERIFGYDQATLIGEPVADYVHPDDRSRVLEAFERVVSSEGETVETVEYRHKRADETYCWVESVASSNTTETGAYVVNTRDISAQKARERELRETNERLDRFANVVSHDLRNPLQVARGRLSLARETGNDDHFDEIERAHERMQTLVEELLTLARTGAPNDLEPVELRSTVTDSWRSVETGDATLVIATDRVVRADPNHLRQLLENLVRNAVEHVGDGVTVSVGDLDAGFYVEDDGPGIPESDRDAVFETGHSTEPRGTGFGLSIVEQITAAHGWSVGIGDGARGGTRFEFTGVEFDR
ncbi:sensor histidine kinase [Haloplanus sp. GCM10025708]|uniref:sensor histidine kinase n=1 Tax=Haloferacaceae TaxID=1644056 RepID=UPI003621434F